MDLQVPLLAAKALLLLLLFAFIYAVVWRGIGDLRGVPEDETFVPGGDAASGNRKNAGNSQNGSAGRAGSGSDTTVERNGRRNGHRSVLVVEGSDVLAPEMRFPVTRGTTSVGRSSGSDIVLKNDDYVSGRHADFTLHGGLLYVEDAGSTNGTYVNEIKAVGATPLRGGDRVRIGSTTFRYSE